MAIVIEKKRLGLFGKKSVICDRCGKKVGPGDTILCKQCFSLDPKNIRDIQFREKHYSDYPEFESGKGSVICDLCNRSISRAESLDLCWSCRSSHSDNTHLKWNIYPINSETMRVNVCFFCGGVQIIRRVKGTAWLYEYMRVGSTLVSNESFHCHKERETIEKVFVTQKKCNHNWLVLRDTTVPLAIGEKKLAELKSEDYKFSNFLAEISEEDLPFMAFGMKWYWCAKCGLHYTPHPLMEHRLPKVGMMALQ